MAKTLQFDGSNDAQHNRPPLCLASEELLPDYLDGLLTPADEAFLLNHMRSCSECTRMLGEAQRGAAWLEMLKSPRPEPSADLMERILASTSGAEPLTAPAVLPAAVMVPMPPLGARILAFPMRFIPRPSAAFQPRLAMTAAMAFFSIALTLNLCGVRLDQLSASDLSPNRVKQSYYAASAGAVRYYDNLPVVHEVESRVDDMRNAAPVPESKTPSHDSQPDRQPDSQPDKQDGGVSRREMQPAVPQGVRTTRNQGGLA